MMRLIIGLVLTALCMFPSTASAIMVFPTTFYSAAGGYEANAVTFDGSNDFLTRGADLTGVSNGKKGIISFFFQFQGGNGSQQYIISGADNDWNITKGTDNKFSISLGDPGGTTKIAFKSSSAYTADTNWHHFLASWDANDPTDSSFLYIDDADDRATVTTAVDAALGYSGDEHIIGAESGGSNSLNAEIADFYVNMVTNLDLSTESNRRKFIDDEDKPVDLGDDCSEPTGSQSIICFTNATATWHTNVGSGGGFTENGALTDAADSPSD